MIVAMTNVLILMVFCFMAGLVAGVAWADRKIEKRNLEKADEYKIGPDLLKRNETKPIIIEE